jgi:hypothetical protein
MYASRLATAPKQRSPRGSDVGAIPQIATWPLTVTQSHHRSRDFLPTDKDIDGNPTATLRGAQGATVRLQYDQDRPCVMKSHILQEAALFKRCPADNSSKQEFSENEFYPTAATLSDGIITYEFQFFDTELQKHDTSSET